MQGFVVLRFWDSDVLQETAAVLEQIAQHALPR
jgi:very-short-patch-repair endonuclease